MDADVPSISLTWNPIRDNLDHGVLRNSILLAICSSLTRAAIKEGKSWNQRDFLENNPQECFDIYEGGIFVRNPALSQLCHSEIK